MLGALPVMMYVLDPEGRIVLRANWSDPDAADQALDALRGNHDASEIRIQDPLPSPLVSLHGLFKGGLRAVWDFARAVPLLIPKRLRYRRHLRRREGAR